MRKKKKRNWQLIGLMTNYNIEIYRRKVKGLKILEKVMFDDLTSQRLGCLRK